MKCSSSGFSIVAKPGAAMRDKYNRSNHSQASERSGWHIGRGEAPCCPLLRDWKYRNARTSRFCAKAGNAQGPFENRSASRAIVDKVRCTNSSYAHDQWMLELPSSITKSLREQESCGPTRQDHRHDLEPRGWATECCDGLTARLCSIWR